ncbi:putative zinc finger, CCHC-type containing protein, partial [Tanacetum coccineum]
LLANGTRHRLSCPHTRQQNGRAERNHRHITETGLEMMFNANVPASLWTYAFGSATYIINHLPTKVLGIDLHIMEIFGFCDGASALISKSSPTIPSPMHDTSLSPMSSKTQPCSLCNNSSPLYGSSTVDSVSSHDVMSHTTPQPVIAPPHTTPHPLSCALSNNHPMVTHSKASIFKHKHVVDLFKLFSHGLHRALFVAQEPKGFKLICY